jgi:hypothetical protein
MSTKMRRKFVEIVTERKTSAPVVSDVDKTLDTEPVAIRTNPNVELNVEANPNLLPRLKGEKETSNPVNVPVKQKDTSGNRLTIYSRSAHMVEKHPAGTTSVTVPKSIILDSIVAIDSNGKVIPFSYVSELNTAMGLTDRVTGKRLEVTVENKDQRFRGEIVSIDGDNVTLIVGGSLVTIHKYSVMHLYGSVDSTRPRLVFKDTNSVSSVVGTPQNFTLSYLLFDISWSCAGTALIDETNNMLYLRLMGNINNSTESDITANTTLVSGEVFQPQQSYTYESKAMYKRAMPMAAMAAPMSSDKVPMSSLEDYVKYKVGNRTVRNKDIAELGTTSYPYEKIYVHHTETRDQTNFGYQFMATGFVPACSVNTYSILPNKEVDAFLGASKIKESQKDTEIRLIIGQSTVVKCTTLIESATAKVRDSDVAREYNVDMKALSRSVAWNVLTEDIKIDIHNSNKVNAHIIIKHPIYDRKVLRVGCGDQRKGIERKGKYVIWHINLKGESEAVFECQLVTGEAALVNSSVSF